ncbi:Eukaryotic phosphomannomutase [uncultured archaeon]|nr:Eukaryotic phosphomannomutase [uncultured archaeon]
MKELIIFDLDGTLAESKMPMDREMSDLLRKLLRRKKVAVISGGAYAQFEKQFLESLDCPPDLLKNLYLFPTCATSFYRHEDGWKNVYEERLSPEERDRILAAFDEALKETGFVPLDRPFGEVIENRGTQITFSALGQNAPIELKRGWDPDFSRRKRIKSALEKRVPEFEIRMGGSTSIDVTRKGIDKAYAISKIEEQTGISRAGMLFIGDALFEGGNDYPVKATGVECIQVSGPAKTKEVIRSLLA